MKHKTFFWFILPSLAAMLLFIALPIVSVAIQSLFVEHEQIMTEVENCGPFKCETVLQVDSDATAALRAEAPLGRFNGLGTYANRKHLAFEQVGVAWAETESWGAFLSELINLPFYKALFFTLTYTAVVTPFVIVLGLAVALGVNALPGMIKRADNLRLASADDRHAADRGADPVLDGRCGRDHRRDAAADRG